VNRTVFAGCQWVDIDHLIEKCGVKKERTGIISRVKLLTIPESDEVF
jgi:hypothetical protein